MKPKTPPRRFIALGTGRSYRSQPLREVPTVSPKATSHPYEDDARRREAELVATATDPRDEPECVGPAILEDYAQVAQLHRSQQHALDVANAQQTRPMLSPHHRLADIRRRAKHAHVDLSHELHILERAIDKARLRGQPVAPGALARLEGLEALLDGVSLREDAA